VIITPAPEIAAAFVNLTIVVLAGRKVIVVYVKVAAVFNVVIRFVINQPYPTTNALVLIVQEAINFIVVLVGRKERMVYVKIAAASVVMTIVMNQPNSTTNALTVVSIQAAVSIVITISIKTRADVVIVLALGVIFIVRKN
jgi:hypothetical protein